MPENGTAHTSVLGNGGFHYLPDEDLNTVVDLSKDCKYGTAKRNAYLAIRRLLPVKYETLPWLSTTFSMMSADCDLVLNYARNVEVVRNKKKRSVVTIGFLAPVEYREDLRKVGVQLEHVFTERRQSGIFGVRSSLRISYIGDDVETGTVDQWHLKFTGNASKLNTHLRELSRLLQNVFFPFSDTIAKVRTTFDYKGV